MKKLLTLTSILLMLLFMTACVSQKHQVKVLFEKIDRQSTTVDLTLSVDDSNNELQGGMLIATLYFDQEEVRSNEVSLANEEINVRFTNLDNTKAYRVVIYGTIKREKIVLAEENIEIVEIIEIKTPEDFLNIKNDITANYILVDHIDFKDIEIDSKNMITRFSGNFDGNNKKISNYNIKESQTVLGLFGRVDSSATIKNLILDNVNIGSLEKPLLLNSFVYAGLLAGDISSSTVVIENIQVNNSGIYMTINSNSLNTYIGGVIGRFKGNMSNVYTNEETVLDITFSKGEALYLGGIVGGYANESSANTAKLSQVGSHSNLFLNVNIEKVLSKTNYQFFVGGVIGFHRSEHPRYLSDIYATGNIEVTDVKLKSDTLLENTNVTFNIGGLLGRTQWGGKNAFYLGNISFNNSEVNIIDDSVLNRNIYIGGIVGTKVYDLANTIVNINSITANIIDSEFANVSISLNEGQNLNKLPISDSVKNSIVTMIENSQIIINDENVEFEFKKSSNIEEILLTEYIKDKFSTLK